MTPPPPATVVLSPHFDDAALSLGGLVPRLPGPVTVVTVYGGEPASHHPVSWWDGVCGFSTAREAYRARRAEDARACALLGVDSVVLDHPDGPYGDGSDLTAIDGFLAELPRETVLLIPLGTNQPDHEKVRDRALEVIAKLGRALPLVYADLPYTGHLDAWGTPGVDAALAGSHLCGLAYQDMTSRHTLRPVHDLTLSDDAWAPKREAVLCYGSQLAPLAADHGMLLARNGPLRAERVWALEEAAVPLAGRSPGDGEV
ncbi:PIG-L family deacetylase [Streptomyces sp. NBC_01498]|uniref:PIG-L family deacetylase n=1 Tax=Streptomyces sp. NBC_01498 TaxID=2975870 RepID=UPI002E7AD428|nr:PIG-L family deacetylase [Streptomyces sp. NBC_01498]WTL28539.1 PIG-L family deacetylase [Streptomyces sp. NBC_01498]